MVNLWVWDKFLVPISVTLGQGHHATVAGQILPCPHDKVRTARPIAKRHDTYIPPAIISTWLNVGGILSETFFYDFFFIKFQIRFWEWDFQGQIWNFLYLSQKWFDCHETKCIHNNWMLGLKWDRQVWPWPWPWPWIFKVKCGICYISAKNCLIATKQKANISIES